MLTDAHIHGQSGPLVLLLPGGAETSDGFFPGLVEGLVESPGCRVVVHDRPGTGASAEEGPLAGAADHLSRLITDLGSGPAVVVGQSLGGAVALLLAIEHPESVAGLVLLDPTPINDPRGCAQLEQVMRVVKRANGVPGVRGSMRAMLLRGMRRSMRRADLRPDCREALDKIGNLDLGRLADSVRGITQLSADFREDSIPRLPAVIVSADRKPDHYIRRSHARLADALGVPLVIWPGAAHNMQLDHPDETLATVRELVARTSLAA